MLLVLQAHFFFFSCLKSVKYNHSSTDQEKSSQLPKATPERNLLRRRQQRGEGAVTTSGCMDSDAVRTDGRTDADHNEKRSGADDGGVGGVGTFVILGQRP